MEYCSRILGRVSIQAIAVSPDFDPAPSVALTATVDVAAVDALPDDADAVGVLIGTDGPVPDIGFDWAALRASGFDAACGSTLVLPAKAGPPRVLVGVGDAAPMLPVCAMPPRPSPSPPTGASGPP